MGPWLDRYPREVPPRLDYPAIPLGGLLARAAAAYPHRTAAWFFGARLDFATLYDRARRVAAALAATGIDRGDRVALYLPNCPQALVAHFGVLLRGAVVVMTNPLYTAQELEHQLRDSGARALVALDLLYPRVQAALPRTDVDLVLITSVADALPPLPARLYRLRQRHAPRVAYSSRVRPLAEAMRHAPPRDEFQVDPAGVAMLQYTGGTTGVPRGCMLTHANLLANVHQTAAWFYRNRPGRETILAALPYFHVYGLTTALHMGVHLAATQIVVPRFEPAQVLKVIARGRPTLFPGVPTMYVAVNRHPLAPHADLRSVEACISGAAPLPPEVARRFEELTGGRLVEGYGLTEASPVTHCNPVWGEARAGSIGLPLPDTDCRIADPGPDGIGELLVRGPQVMAGYWNRPDETAAVLQDGWLRTGDLARQDADGYFYIAGRLKELIIAGGFNIYPREIEDVLYAHPAVEECAVVGVPDAYRGETVVAFVRLREGAAATAEELAAHCRQRLAAFKVPRRFELRAELPKSAVGKILHRVLAEEARARQVGGIGG